MKAEVVTHRTRERHDLGAVHQWLERAKNLGFARSFEVGRGLLLFRRILERKRRKAVGCACPASQLNRLPQRCIG